MKHLEIEHKFIVESYFDRDAFFSRIRSMRGSQDRESHVDTTDTYYVIPSVSNGVLRHRCDAELQHLSFKGLEEDSQVRREINLILDQKNGDQSESVAAFLACFGSAWSAVIRKKVDAFYFEHCEVVFYEAQHEDLSVSCVEFEAKACATVEESLEKLHFYENALGFSDKKRSDKSLFELLLSDRIPEPYKRNFANL